MQSDYKGERSPLSNRKYLEEIMEVDHSVRKIQDYCDKIYTLSSQNQEMANTIAHLQQELKRERSKGRLNTFQDSSYSKKDNSYNSRNLMVNSNSLHFPIKQSSVKDLGGQVSLRQMRNRREYHPLISVDTNTDTLKRSANHSKNSYYH